MKLLPIANWELMSQKEIFGELSSRSEVMAAKSNKAKTGSVLVLRSHIRPLDLYTYLRARFGPPNGLVQKLFSANSANLLHWDYYIRTGDSRIIIHGMTREAHIITSYEISDTEWLTFFDELKRDFARFGREKSAVQKSLERWHVFQNKYAAIADTCAELHGDISDETRQATEVVSYGSNGLSSDQYAELMKAISARANRIYGKCLQLRLLTPILFESFINYLVLCLAKPDLRKRENFWPDFREMAFHEKLKNLDQLCLGFKGAIVLSTDTAKSFLRVRSDRNDYLHGNFNPETDFIEKVYFDGKIPLYEVGGDRVKLYWMTMESYIDPEGAVEDYEATLLFVAEVMGYLEDPYRQSFEILLEEALPGWDLNRKILGKLFPAEVVQIHYEALRYDDEIQEPTVVDR